MKDNENEEFELNLPKDFYLTSDTWFGRTEILNIANRNFKNIEEMNDQFIKNWNKKVKRNDTVFHLGNFAWDAETAKYVLDNINGKLYFMLGNMDYALEEVADDYDNVTIVENEILHLPEFNLVLSHFPLEVWCGKEVGVTHIHGHTVFSHKTDLREQNRINVCVDYWDYSPIKLSSIFEIIKLSKNG